MFLVITLRTRKWLTIGICKPPNQKGEYSLKILGVVLNNYFPKYKLIIFLGDFYLETSSKYLAHFMMLFNLESLINTPTFFQSEKPQCTDFIVTNENSFFKNSKTSKVGISDHLLLVLTPFNIFKSKYSG